MFSCDFMRKQLFFQLLICAICPLPGVRLPKGGDSFLCSLMFLRLYWLPRCLHLHSRLSTDAAAKSIAGLNRVKTDTRFMLKRMLFLYPGKKNRQKNAPIIKVCQKLVSKTDSFFSGKNSVLSFSLEFAQIDYFGVSNYFFF